MTDRQVVERRAVLAAIDHVQDALADLEAAPHGSEDQRHAADEVHDAAKALLHLVDQVVTA